MKKIKLSYESMEGQANLLKQHQADFLDCVGEMKSTISALPDYWEGLAADEYIKQFEALQPAFEATRSIIEEIEMQLRNTMSEMQAKDAEIAGKLDF